MFAHGTTLDSATTMVEGQGQNLTARRGNFDGKLFAVPDVEVARVFAARPVTRASGSQPGLVGIALPKPVADRLRQSGLLIRQAIPNPPPGVPIGEQEWVFLPGALETLRSEGFFFLIQ